MPDVFPIPRSRLDRIRRVMDGVGVLIERAVSDHDGEIEDCLLACQASLVRIQAAELEKTRAK